MEDKPASIKYCPRCGSRAVNNACPYHGYFYGGTPIRVCLNGHIVEINPPKK